MCKPLNWKLQGLDLRNKKFTNKRDIPRLLVGRSDVANIISISPKTDPRDSMHSKPTQGFNGFKMLKKLHLN